MFGVVCKALDVWSVTTQPTLPWTCRPAGNMCAHRPCAEELVQLGVLDVIAGLAKSRSSDTVKYAQRLSAKLDAAFARPGV